MDGLLMFSRRSFLKRSLFAGTTAGAFALAGQSSIASATLTKTQAGYQDKPSANQRCELCKHFAAPNACHLVQGEISTQGWCHFYSVT